jgi:hypothetical protein
MRIARLDTHEGPRYAVWTGHAWEVVADCFGGTGVSIAPDDAHLLSPCEPRVLVGIAHNKANNGHVLPILPWHKSVRSVVSPNAGILARRDVGTVNIAGELAVVIGRDTAGITVNTAFDYLLGYTVVNDVTNVDRNAVARRTSKARADTVTPRSAPRSRPSSMTPSGWPSESSSTELSGPTPAPSTCLRPSPRASPTWPNGSLSGLAT